MELFFDKELFFVSLNQGKYLWLELLRPLPRPPPLSRAKALTFFLIPSIFKTWDWKLSLIPANLRGADAVMGGYHSGIRPIY